MSNDLFIGEVVSFKYSGGENPGTTRYVYILTPVDKNGNFIAYCFNRQEKRTFKESRVDNLNYDVDYNEVSLHGMPVAFQDGKILSKQYDKDGYLTFLDEDKDVLVIIAKSIVNPPKAKPIIVAIGSLCSQFIVPSTDGNRSITLYATKAQGVYCPSIKDYKFNMTTKELIEVLNRLENV